MRKRIWQLHSVVGLIAGAALLVIGLTGSILMFSDEVDGLFHPQLVRVQPQGSPLSYDTLMRRVEAQLPGWEIARWQIRPDPAAAYVARVCPVGGNADLRAYVNPYTGEVMGKRAWKETVAGWLLEVHFSFLAGDWGTVFAGVMAALLLVSAVSGVWLYRDFWRNLFRLRWRASARIFCSSLHKAVGISSVAFNLVLGFTGAWWNLQALPALWHNDPVVNRAPGRFFSDRVSVDALIAQAPRLIPGLDLSELQIDFPSQTGDPVTVSGRTPTGNPFRSISSGVVNFDAQTGAVAKIIDMRREPLWTRVQDTFFALHFGTFGGLPIKILWCLGGLSPGTLAVSGFVIWWSRRRRVRPTRTVSTETPKELKTLSSAP